MRECVRWICVCAAVVATAPACASEQPDAGSGSQPVLAELVIAIGNDETRGPDYTFGAVAAVALDADGRIYVADRSDSQIRVYSSDGALVQAIGREGQGPGEFRVPVDLGFGDDGALWVRDLTRIQKLTTRAEGAVPDSLVLTHMLTGYASSSRAAAGDSLYYSPAYFFPLSGGSHYFYEVFGPRGVIDTLIVPAFANLERVRRAAYRVGRVSREEGQLIATMNLAPFEARPVWKVTASGTLLLSSGEEAVVREIAFGEQQRTVQEFRLPFSRESISPDEAADSLAVLRSRLDRISVPLGDIWNLSDYVRRGEVPDSFPMVLDIHRGGAYTWVEVWPGAQGMTDFFRFDAHGATTGYLRIPVTFSDLPPYFGDGQIVGVTVDPDTGVEQVVLFRFAF